MRFSLDALEGNETEANYEDIYIFKVKSWNGNKNSWFFNIPTLNLNLISAALDVYPDDCFPWPLSPASPPTKPFTFSHWSLSSHHPCPPSIRPPHPWGETLLGDKFSSGATQCSLTHFSAPLSWCLSPPRIISPRRPLVQTNGGALTFAWKTMTSYWHYFRHGNEAFCLCR